MKLKVADGKDVEPFHGKVNAVTHYVGEEKFKPWWSEEIPEYVLSAAREHDLHISIKGFNSCSPSNFVDDLLFECIETGVINRKSRKGETQNYLVEIDVKITPLIVFKDSNQNGDKNGEGRSG